MNNLLFTLVLVAMTLVEGKPAFPTESPQVRVTPPCVGLSACAGKPPGRNYRHTTESGWFYTCFEDVTQIPVCQECPGQFLHFSEKCQMCLYENDDSRITTCPIVSETVTGTAPFVTCNQAFCGDKDDGLYPVTNDVTKFYHCSNRMTYCKQCQSGLRYDHSCRACVDPSHTTTTTLAPPVTGPVA